VHLGGDAEAFQHLAGARFQGVAVVAQDQVLHLGVAVGVELPLGVGEEALLLHHRLPYVVVAHHGHFEDGHVLVAEVVLLQHTQLEALGHGDRAVARQLLAGEDAEKRRLARTVGPHEAVAVARVELDRDSLEQSLGAVGFTEVGDGDHRAGNDSRGREERRAERRKVSDGSAFFRLYRRKGEVPLALRTRTFYNESVRFGEGGHAKAYDSDGIAEGHLPGAR
jgi:hypothetical protein